VVRQWRGERPEAACKRGVQGGQGEPAGWAGEPNFAEVTAIGKVAPEPVIRSTVIGPSSWTIAPLLTATRLSPFDPRMTSWRHPMARAHYLAMDFSEAVSEARQALHASPNYRAIHITLIAALGSWGSLMKRTRRWLTRWNGAQRCPRRYCEVSLASKTTRVNLRPPLLDG
jgi:hypothetical protein